MASNQSSSSLSSSSFITPVDRLISSGVILSFKQGKSTPAVSVEFQFPPKILSDNRRGSWAEGELMGTEPVSVFKTSGPREMTLSWTYIVESLDSNNSDPTLGRSSWDIMRIRRNVNTVRGYFARLKNSEGDRSQLVVNFAHPVLAGIGIKTCRIKSVNVKHSENFVGGSVSGTSLFNSVSALSSTLGGKIFYPLKTDISVDLRLWTRPETDANGKVGGIPDEADSKDYNVQGMPELSRNPSPDDLWY